MTAAIRVENVAHRFGHVDALQGVSFEVGAGDVFGFIGPNGAGKTTMIRSIATLHAPDRGRIEVCGVDARRAPERVRRVLGYMPDHAGVYERITGAEYLEFFAAVQGIAIARVHEVVALTGLASAMDRNVSELSKGLKQRMQLARVLLHDPQVLVLDEPASDLDPRARIELRELILELRRRGKTILLSSHILTELDDICTHVGILEHGRMLAYGPIDEVARKASQRERPAGSTAGAYRTAAETLRRGARMRVIGDAERVKGALAEVEGIGDVVVSNLGAVSLRYDGDERKLGLAVRALALADVLVCSVEPEQNDLERVFLELTKGNGTC